MSYFGVISIHSLLTRLWFPLRDPRDAENFLKSPLAPLVNGFFFNVDTFLLISGLLITITILKELEKWELMMKRNIFDHFISRGSFNIMKTYFRRYLRITPVLTALLLTVLYHLHWSPESPYFFSKDFKNRFDNWWASFLYIQNYVDVEKPVRIFWFCMKHKLNWTFRFTRLLGICRLISNFTSFRRLLFIRCGDGNENPFSFYRLCLRLFKF